MRSNTLHMTLAFLGETPLARLDALRELAATIPGEAFTLTLDRLGCWKHNRIGWLGVQDTPQALAQLVSNFRGVLHAEQFAVDDQHYVPHVTLLRNAQCRPPPSCPPVTWRAKDFVLLASHKQRPGYDLLGTWPLSA